MEFIESMKEVWLASEKSKRENEERKWKREERQWRLEIPAIEHEQDKNVELRSQVPRDDKKSPPCTRKLAATRGRNLTPDIPAREHEQDNNVEPKSQVHKDNNKSPKFAKKLAVTRGPNSTNGVLGEMLQSLGSLSISMISDDQTSQRPNEATMPPNYDDMYQNFSTASPSSQTEVKQPCSPESTEVKQVCRFQSNYTNDTIPINSADHDRTPEKLLDRGDASGDTDSEENMTPKQKSDLGDFIKTLLEEQEILKKKISEHDKSLTSLLKRQIPTFDECLVSKGREFHLENPSKDRTQDVEALLRPSIHRRLSANAKEIMFSSKISPLGGFAGVLQNKRNQNLKEEENFYAQIEHLYANLCRIHFPIQQKTAAQCLTINQDQIYSVPSSYEMGLYQENKELKEKIMMLENRLAENTAPPKPTDSSTDENSIESLKYTTDENSIESLKYTTVGKSIESLNYTTDGNITAGCYANERPKSPGIMFTDREIIAYRSKRELALISSRFEWVISDYFEKLELEKWGKCPNTTSEPFYIGQFGYLAQLETYLNGNGTGYDKCMSVFLRIIKGKYDDSLEWPATFSLTFTLVNQEDNKMDSLSYFEKDSTFVYDKPSGDSYDDSDSWGLVEFVSHDTINQRKYIKDDTIKLQIKILK